MFEPKLHFLAFLARAARRGSGFRLLDVEFEPRLRVRFAAPDPRPAAAAVAELAAAPVPAAPLRAFRVPAAEARMRLSALGIDPPALPDEPLLWEYQGALYPFPAPPPEAPPSAPAPDLDGPLPYFADPDETETAFQVAARDGRGPLHFEHPGAGDLFVTTPGGPVMQAAGVALLDRLESAVREIYAEGGFEEFRPFAAGAAAPAEWLAARLPLPVARLPYRFFHFEMARRAAPAADGFGLHGSPMDRIDRAAFVCDLAQAPLVCGEAFAMVARIARRFDLPLSASALVPPSGEDGAGLVSAARVMARANGFPVAGEFPATEPGVLFRLNDPAGRPFAAAALRFARSGALRHADRAGRERPSLEARLTLTGGLLRLLAHALERGTAPLAPLPGGRA